MKTFMRLLIFACSLCALPTVYAQKEFKGSTVDNSLYASKVKAVKKRKNEFTKVQMNIRADALLLNYFRDNIEMIENWFNIISPKAKTLENLQEELVQLKDKHWIDILQ